MGGFFDANYNITKLSKDAEGNITELELNGKAVEIGAATLDNNKTATIDVSTYTEPVVITPTSGKDGMKKATVTLSNIPTETPLFVFPNSGGGSSILTVATFAEIEVGMKAYSSSEVSGVLFMGTVKELVEDQGYFIEEDGKPSGEGYSVYINSESTSTEFPSFDS